MSDFPHLIMAERGVPDDYPHYWGYAGACSPTHSHWSSQLTFSVGVFPIFLKADGKGKKRGPVVKRFMGYMAHADRVYARAEEYGARLDAGGTR